MQSTRSDSDEFNALQESLWEVQRVITLIKRCVRHAVSAAPVVLPPPPTAETAATNYEEVDEAAVSTEATNVDVPMNEQGMSWQALLSISTSTRSRPVR